MEKCWDGSFPMPFLDYLTRKKQNDKLTSVASKGLTLILLLLIYFVHLPNQKKALIMNLPLCLCPKHSVGGLYLPFLVFNGYAFFPSRIDCLGGTVFLLGRKEKNNMDCCPFMVIWALQKKIFRRGFEDINLADKALLGSFLYIFVKRVRDQIGVKSWSLFNFIDN